MIGQIEKIEKHPDADKLIICQVNIGTESVQIVTGAPNVKEGDKVPVVLDGGRVAGGHDGKMTPGGIKIKKGKLRGVESCGMMCSIEELGSTREMYPEAPEYGIYIFPEDAVVGESAIKALGLDDVVFEYEITSNRVDCYGVLGIAREAAATFDKKFFPPVVKETGNDEKASDYVKGYCRGSGALPELLRKSCKKCQDRPVPEMDAEMPGFQRNPPDQQPGRYHKLCNGRVRTANACIRSGYHRKEEKSLYVVRKRMRNLSHWMVRNVIWTSTF